jgi:hypothetical protein
MMIKERVAFQINKCVSPTVKVNQLDLRAVMEVVNRYKLDITADNFEVTLLDNEEMESFIKYKYPILRLR